MNEDFAKMVFCVLCIVIPVLWRMLASWASNRPTTWYWNPVTKKFVLNRVSAILGKMFGRGVNDCNVQYEKDLPPEAIEALRDRINKTYPAPAIEPDNKE